MEQPGRGCTCLPCPAAALKRAPTLSPTLFLLLKPGLPPQLGIPVRMLRKNKDKAGPYGTVLVYDGLVSELGLRGLCRRQRRCQSTCVAGADERSSLCRAQYDVTAWREVKSKKGKLIYQYHMRRRPGQGKLQTEVHWRAQGCWPRCPGRRPAFVLRRCAASCAPRGHAAPAAFPAAQTLTWGAVKASKQLVPTNRRGVVDLDISREPLESLVHRALGRLREQLLLLALPLAVGACSPPHHSPHRLRPLPTCCSGAASRMRRRQGAGAHRRSGRHLAGKQQA